MWDVDLAASWLQALSATHLCAPVESRQQQALERSPGCGTDLQN